MDDNAWGGVCTDSCLRSLTNDEAGCHDDGEALGVVTRLLAPNLPEKGQPYGAELLCFLTCAARINQSSQFRTLIITRRV